MKSGGRFKQDSQPRQIDDEEYRQLIDLNSTLLVQWAIFIFLMIFLNQFLFKPVLRVIDARREKVEGTHESAETLNERAKQHQANYEARINQAKEQAEQASAVIREATIKDSKDKMDKARGEAMKQVEEIRQRIAVEYQKVQEEMTADIKEIARQISGKILERDI
jgi:F-type H+-transporting ATPase subunit b